MLNGIFIPTQLLPDWQLFDTHIYTHTLLHIFHIHFVSFWDDTFQLGLISRERERERKKNKISNGRKEERNTQRFHHKSFRQFTRICLSLMFYLSDFRQKCKSRALPERKNAYFSMPENKYNKIVNSIHTHKERKQLILANPNIPSENSLHTHSSSTSRPAANNNENYKWHIPKTKIWNKTIQTKQQQHN